MATSRHARAADPSPALPPALPATTAAPAPPAHAPSWPPPGQAPTVREETRVERYYVPILISDAMTATLVTAAYVQGHGGNAVLGAMNYLITPPIIHGNQGRVGMVFASFGVRVGAPLVAVSLLQAVGGDRQDYVIPGIFAGMIGASILDAAVFARKTVTVPVSSWSPTVSPQRGGATLGLGGAW